LYTAVLYQSGATLLSLVYLVVVSVDQVNALLSVRIRLRITRYIRIEDEIQRVRNVVLWPQSLRPLVRLCLPPRVRVQVMHEADPVAVHESCKVAVTLGLVRKGRVLKNQLVIGL
jgi:heme exporter protein D